MLFFENVSWHTHQSSSEQQYHLNLLIPDVDFDEDALKNNLFVRDEYPYLKEGIEAREYIENRMFIIAKK